MVWWGGASLSLTLSIDIFAKLNGSCPPSSQHISRNNSYNYRVLRPSRVIGRKMRAFVKLVLFFFFPLIFFFFSLALPRGDRTWLLEYFRQLAACHRLLVRPAEGWAIMSGGGRRSPVGLPFYSLLFSFLFLNPLFCTEYAFHCSSPRRLGKLGLIFWLVDTGTATVTITLAYDVDIHNTCSVEMEFVCFLESISY